ncbi:hypothetical protein BS47DRAFT_1488836 [Hydnum rufescens UP504]|uniref:Rhodanese domain-containing protein n=1 Tax=Hydnum rufescens UP504 TaxID=1448309 RepID=A0A9P6AKI6_9AGAM|nr:hypothetical protein BS47DRAFT_1488836 [Hydnum rufescens UP504]
MSSIARATLRAAKAGRLPLSLASVSVRPGVAGIQTFRQSCPRPISLRQYSSPVLSGRPIPVVTYEQLKPLTEQPSLTRALIDVREVALEQSPDSFRNTYGFERPEKDQEIIFYCRSGKRSTTASEHAQRLGWTNVKNYTGSWLDWVEKEQGGSKPAS